MSVTVTGNDIHDVKQKIGYQAPVGGIHIYWRGGRDFGRIPETGCIVDATWCNEDVKRSFKTAGLAIAYLRSFLKRHDAWVKAEHAKLKKESKPKK